MITSIFDKSKPINFIIVASIIVLSFCFRFFFEIGEELNQSYQFALSLFIVFFCLFLSDFIISKNSLNRRNSYAILVFSLQILIFPEVFNDLELLTTNLLVLFASRRLLSLHSKKSINKKFFDACFWIALASLFYSWALLFFVLVFIAFIYYWQGQIKYLFTSVLGIVTIATLLLLYNILFKDTFFAQSNFDFTYSLDFSSYNGLGEVIAITVLFAIYIWSSIYYLTYLREKKNLRPVRILIFVLSIIALVVLVLSPNKTGGEFLFFMFPFSVIAGNYIQNVKELWFKELFIFLLLASGIAKLLL